MNKQELTKKVAERVDGATIKSVDAVIKEMLEVIKEELARGEKVQLKDFGAFEVRERAARKGRNPRKPEEIIDIPASKIPAFKAGKSLKKKINE